MIASLIFACRLGRALLRETQHRQHGSECWVSQELDPTYCPLRAALAKRLASSAARNNALALSTHSCCSDFGLESATMPAPACTYITPSLIRAVRRTMQLSSSPAAEK